MLLAIFKKALQAISMIPGNSSFMNSNNFFTTVLKKVQLFLRNVGYCPTTYMIQEAITALFYFPFFISHKWRRVLKVLIKKLFYSFSRMDPHKDPTIQDRLLRDSKENSSGVCCPYIWVRMNFFISGQSILTKNEASSLMISYRLEFSVFSIYSLTG